MFLFLMRPGKCLFKRVYKNPFDIDKIRRYKIRILEDFRNDHQRYAQTPLGILYVNSTTLKIFEIVDVKKGDPINYLLGSGESKSSPQ